jgi:transposase
MDSKAKDSTVTTIGIDIGKNTFHLVGLDKRGSIVLRRKVSRGRVVVRLANMPGFLWRPSKAGIQRRVCGAIS